MVSEAIETLDAKASHEGAQHEVHIRVAHADGGIYIDLCNETWQVAKITPQGWSIEDQVPVKFIRTPGMLPLPTPVKGGRLADLRPLINAPTDETWCPVAAWITGAFSKGPYAVLVILGEQGSAKTFAKL